jgi:alpha-mannosidase
MDHKGNHVPHQLLDKTGIDYWAHNYVRLLIYADILSYGFCTYHITQKDMEDVPVSLPNWERLMDNDSYILENDKVRARFNPQTLALESLVDKDIGKELIDSGRKGGLFNLVNEDTTKGMSSWVIGRYKKVVQIEENLVVTGRNIDSNALRQWISFKGGFSGSTIKVTVSLDKGSSVVVYDTECDWHEKAEHKVTVQQLNFKLPLAGTYSSYRYDIPMGTIDRPALEHDVPGLGYASAINEDGGVMIISSDRYGYRGFDNSLAITLIRNSTNPDPYPESGINRMRFGIAALKNTEICQMYKMGYGFNHAPIAVSGLVQKGELQPDECFIEINEGEICISAVKMAEDNPREMVIRFFEPKGVKQNVRLTFKKEPVNACCLDINERKKTGAVNIKGNSVSFQTEAGCTGTIGILFKN